MELAKRKCIPCEGGVAKLTHNQIRELNLQLIKPWKVVDEMKITKEFDFDNYPETIEFLNNVAQIAEEEGHHPVLHVYFNKLIIDIWTHAIMGLSENDFILAAKIDNIQIQ